MKHKNECAKLLISELGSKATNALNDSGVTAAHISASAGNHYLIHCVRCTKIPRVRPSITPLLQLQLIVPPSNIL